MGEGVGFRVFSVLSLRRGVPAWYPGFPTTFSPASAPKRKERTDPDSAGLAGVFRFGATSTEGAAHASEAWADPDRHKRAPRSRSKLEAQT